jgi:hypothetical protein
MDVKKPAIDANNKIKYKYIYLYIMKNINNIFEKTIEKLEIMNSFFVTNNKTNKIYFFVKPRSQHREYNIGIDIQEKIQQDDFIVEPFKNNISVNIKKLGYEVIDEGVYYVIPIIDKEQFINELNSQITVDIKSDTMIGGKTNSIKVSNNI